MNNTIFFTEDLIERYTAKRKGMLKEDTADLLRCLLKFIKNDIKKNKNYAYEIPNIGVMYTKMDNETSLLNNYPKYITRYDQIMVEYLKDKRTPLKSYSYVDRLINRLGLEELQKQQNDQA